MRKCCSVCVLLGVHCRELCDEEAVALGDGHLGGGGRQVALKLQDLLLLTLAHLHKQQHQPVTRATLGTQTGGLLHGINWRRGGGRDTTPVIRGE